MWICAPLRWKSIFKITLLRILYNLYTSIFIISSNVNSTDIGVVSHYLCILFLIKQKLYDKQEATNHSPHLKLVLVICISKTSPIVSEQVTQEISKGRALKINSRSSPLVRLGTTAFILKLILRKSYKSKLILKHNMWNLSDCTERLW